MNTPTQIKTDISNLMTVNFATLDFIFKNRVDWKHGVPPSVLDAIGKLEEACLNELNEILGDD